jgi:isoaspartyl peptidase/L-asparaginase-like protein (Ntn-hydrolase superfamily)
MGGPLGLISLCSERGIKEKKGEEKKKKRRRKEKKGEERRRKEKKGEKRTEQALDENKQTDVTCGCVLLVQQGILVRIPVL